MTIAMLCQVPASAQVDFGVKGGVQLAKLDFSNDFLKESNRLGFYAGPTLKISLPIVGFGIDVSAFYEQCKFEVEGNYLTQKDISIPVYLRLGADIANFGFFIFAGPQFKFNLGDSSRRWTDANGDMKQYVFDTTTLYGDVGLGLRVGQIEGSAAYCIPLGKTGDFTWTKLTSQISDSWNYSKSRTNTWKLSVTFFF